jgi:hypothetical protein
MWRQMEIEYFIPPDEDAWQAFHEQWLTDSYNFLLSIGLRPELISRDVHPDHKLAHYARACTDLMFKFPCGTQELQGVAARGCFDLTQHGTASGKSMEYFDEVRKEKYVPHVIEPSIGVDRLMLAVLCSAYAEDEVGGETYAFAASDALPSGPSAPTGAHGGSPHEGANCIATVSRSLTRAVLRFLCVPLLSQALRAALPSAARSHQGSGLPARQEQAGADREGAGNLHAVAAALLRHVRHRWCHRPPLPAHG